LFSQPNEAPILLNPANSGSQYDLRATANYRQQWRSITSPYKTIAASVDGKVLTQGKNGSTLGAGLSFYNDMAGEGRLVTNQVNLSVSGKITLAKNQTLSTGIYGGFVQRHIATSDLTWGSQYNGLVYDPSLSSGETFSSESFFNGDFGAGLQWSYGKGSRTLSSNDMFGGQIGFAAFHVNSPNSGFYAVTDKRAIRYLVHATGSYGIKNTNMQLSPMFIYQRQGPAQMIYVGTFIKYRLQESSKYTDYVLSRTVSIGGFMRSQDAIAIAAQCELGQMAFGISYDINISSLSKVSSGKGGFEISIRYLPIRSSGPSRLI
jgi:type IX secretion system PorP/SprF family membrane protein